jgi:glycosyltransferase involved in cell wall biosynthesis
MTPRNSIVIPAYNEAKLLGRLLDSLDVAQAAYGNPCSI